MLLPAEHGSRPVSAQGLRTGVDEQLRRQTGRVRKEVEQQGRRVRAAWVRRVRRRTTGQRAAAGEGKDEGVDEGVDAAGES